MMQQQSPFPPPPAAAAPAAAAESPSSSPSSSPFAAPRRPRRLRDTTAPGPIPSLLALLHALALAALVVYECIVGFPLAQDWRDDAAAATTAGPSPSSSLNKEADALWWLSLIAAIALLLFLVLSVMARLALALSPDIGGGRAARGPPQLPRQVAPPSSSSSPPPLLVRRRRRRLLLSAAAWLPAGVIACADFARFVVLASGNNKRRLASPASPAEDCAAGPAPQDETRAAFHPSSPGGLSAPTCDRFRMAVILAVASVCFVVLSLLYCATPRRPLSRLLLAPLLAVAAAALLLAKPVTSLMLFVYVQREALARGGSDNAQWSGELVLALISLLLASAGAAFVLMAALALGAPWALCAAAEWRAGGGARGGGGGGKGETMRQQQQQQQQQQEMAMAAAAEEEAAPPGGAAFGPVAGVPEPGPYHPRPGTSPAPAATQRRARSLAATLAALVALVLLAMQLPAAFGLIAPVVALAVFPDLWGNFWVDLDFALGVFGIVLFSLAVVAAVWRAAAGGRGDGGGGDDDDDDDGGAEMGAEEETAAAA